MCDNTNTEISCSQIQKQKFGQRLKRRNLLNGDEIRVLYTIAVKAKNKLKTRRPVNW